MPPIDRVAARVAFTIQSTSEAFVRALVVWGTWQADHAKRHLDETAAATWWRLSSTVVEPRPPRSGPATPG